MEYSVQVIQIWKKTISPIFFAFSIWYEYIPTLGSVNIVTNWYYWPWWSKVPVSSHTGQNIRECFWTFKRTNFILIHINLIYPLWKMWSLEDPETNHNVLRGGCRYLFQIENKIHLMGYFSPYITWDKQSTRELWPGSKCSTYIAFELS